MFLIDSNIIIYSALSENDFLRKYFYEQKNFVSVISEIEVLGYSKLSASEKNYFYACFELLHKIRIEDSIIQKSIQLKQAFKLSLGDSIIASTALIHNLTLLTRNTEDFKSID